METNIDSLVNDVVEELWPDPEYGDVLEILDELVEEYSEEFGRDIYERVLGKFGDLLMRFKDEDN